MTAFKRVTSVLVLALIVGGAFVSSQATRIFPFSIKLGNACLAQTGTGTPEGSVTGAICDVYLRTNGSSGTVLYVKESGSGNTGWVAHRSETAGLLKATTVVTDAQVKAWPTTPIVLVSAPGAGLRIEINKILIYVKLISPYTNIDPNAWMAGRLSTNDITDYVFNSTTWLPSGATWMSDLLAGAVSPDMTYVELKPWYNVPADQGGWGSIARVETQAGYRTNTALALFMDNAAAGNLTGGNASNVFRVVTFYTIETAP